jgi:flavodoxin
LLTYSTESSTLFIDGKTILPFCTNEGSGMGISEQDIAKSAKGAVLKAGLSLNGSDVKNSKPAIESWLRENGVIEYPESEVERRSKC